MHFTETNFHKIDEEGSISENTDLNLDNNPYWTQTVISKVLTISDKKPEISNVESVRSKARAIRQKVIYSPKSVACNLDGKHLTGRILVVEGKIDQLVYYTANLPEETIHTGSFTSNFVTSIVVPRSIKDIDSLNISFQINICIEDVSITEVCEREILESIVLLIQAVPIASF